MEFYKDRIKKNIYKDSKVGVIKLIINVLYIQNILIKESWQESIVTR
jgi:hypothetical protein